MNIYYNYSRYEDDDMMREAGLGDFGRDSGAHRWRMFTGIFPEWFGPEDKTIRILPWIGGMAIGLGILLILFPILLVVAVASLFFAAGAVCLAVWWHLRAPVHRIRIGSRSDWLSRVKRWFRQRIG